MKREELNYELPAELIAQRPSEVRGESRLLVFERSRDNIADRSFGQITEFLYPGDCLVLNDTRVLPARFFARRGSGGALEGLFLEESEYGVWRVLIKGSGKIKAGERIYLSSRGAGDYCGAVVLAKEGGGQCLLKPESEADSETILGSVGFVPLPPYIKRDSNFPDGVDDQVRYQTVYARRAGAVAAPTAGLHFTHKLIEQLGKKGIRSAYVTLHVGAGTFQPITEAEVDEHEMHEERFSIDDTDAMVINEAKRDGGRIVAVGTTSARVIETVATESSIRQESGLTRLFIRPGYKFKMVDAMVTNFHLPCSTLLAMVAAFAGLKEVRRVYQHAIEQGYRFYSYGDAMLIV